jgi:acyl-coenzyme A thioesterase PaaI-like protein
MRAAAATARALAADLAEELHPTPWRPRPPDARAAFAQHANPLLPELTLDWVGERLVGRARLVPSYGGPPGLVHGGVLALMCDQVLGMLLDAVGRPSFTARLSVDYLAGTPLEEDLELVGEVTETVGRRTTAVVAIGPPGTVTARGTGTMVTIRPVGPDGRVPMQATR